MNSINCSVLLHVGIIGGWLSLGVHVMHRMYGLNMDYHARGLVLHEQARFQTSIVESCAFAFVLSRIYECEESCGFV